LSRLTLVHSNAHPPAARPFPLHAGVAEVVKVARLTPSMARITLTAPAFADFGVEEPGEIITLGWAGAEHHWRNYTVRRIDPDRAEVDVDFVLHGDHGRASAWAARAAPGREIGFAGPRTHWRREPGADWTLLVADETGVPALLSILEALPAEHPVLAVAEVGGPQERLPAARDVQWLFRGGAAGTTDLLARTVQALELPRGCGRAWGGGEARAMRAVRDHLREDRGLHQDAVRVLGYWRRD
jgi:NADPH-dependent ferric siderophore reductase